MSAPLSLRRSAISASVSVRPQLLHARRGLIGLARERANAVMLTLERVVAHTRVLSL